MVCMLHLYFILFIKVEFEQKIVPEDYWNKNTVHFWATFQSAAKENKFNTDVYGGNCIIEYFYTPLKVSLTE